MTDGSTMNGFNFADESEAEYFYAQVQSAISHRSQSNGQTSLAPPAPPNRSTAPSRNAPRLPSRPPSNENNSTSQNYGKSTPPARYEQPQTMKAAPPSMRPEPTIQSRPPSSASVIRPLSSEKKDEESDSKKEKIQGMFGFGKKKKEKKIDKVLISAPSNFQHLSHVGYNPDSGFDATNIPAEWRAIFAKAGISDLELSDKKNIKVISKFMATHGDPNAPTKPARSKAPPPPPNSRNASSPAQSVPKPPLPPISNRQQPLAPPVSNRAQPVAPPPRQNRSNDIPVAPRIPDRNVSNDNVPPPPPPPMFSPPNALSQPQAPPSISKQAPPQGNARVDLMAAIQSGHQLKGRSTTINQPKVEEVEEPEDLAAAIRAALDARKGAIMDSDDEEEDDEEDEW